MDPKPYRLQHSLQFAVLYEYNRRLDDFPDVAFDIGDFYIWLDEHECQRCFEDLATADHLCYNCDLICNECSVAPENPSRCKGCSRSICDRHKYTCSICKKVSCCSSCQDNILPNCDDVYWCSYYMCEDCDPSPFRKQS